MELVKSVGHPAELWALIKYKFLGGKNVVIPKVDYSTLSSGMKRCYQLLNQTSRSFSAVIQSLDDDLRPAVVIFYLVLRALDTVEDDMTIPLREKIPMLQQFHKYLQLAEWRYMDSQEKDKAVLEEFPFISGEFRALKPVFQDVISDITRQMGSGMCVFLEKEVDSMDQWDEYCHYVAGLVGIGLTKLFMASGLEKGMEQEEEEEEASRRQGSSNGDHNSSVVLGLSNSMGLFLQKTNIIRDYLEDSLQDREFWPKEAWGQFVSELKDFQQPERRREAVQCLNLLITNALGQLPDVLQYMSRIHNQSIFNFCAIPQTMAIATLALCYNNPEVFTGVVKIRKGVAVALIMESTNMDNLKAIFAQFAEEIASKVDPSDPSSAETIAITHRVMDLCSDTHSYSGTKQSPLSPSPSSASSKVPLITGATALAAAMATYAYWSGYWTT